MYIQRLALSRSRRRFFFSFSLGLPATPSRQERTFAMVTLCSSSGHVTRIVNRVTANIHVYVSSLSQS